MAGTTVDYARPRGVDHQYSMIQDLLLRRDPGAPMLIDGDGVWTCADMLDAARAFAGGLAELGVGKGDRVGVSALQCRDTAALHLAILWLGAVILPLSTREAPASRASKLARAGASVFLFDPRAGEAPATDCPVVTMDGSGDLDIDRFRRADPAGLPVQTERDDPALLVFTSGTTGTPRGALLPHRILPARLPAFCLAQNHAPQEGDRFWTPVEWTWVGSLVDSLFTPWAMGMPVVLHPHARFDPEQAARLIDDLSVRNIFLPPTALRLMEASGVKVSGTLRALHSGGEALNPEILDWAGRTFGTVPNEIYGQTEASFLIGSGGSNGRRAGHIGRPYPPHDVRLLDEHEGVVRPGEVGEICVPTDDPTLFLGYWGEDTTHATGWWHTGDLAVADEDGFIKFIGRKDDLIICSGYRVDPQQVEQELMNHPAVALAAVVGVPDQMRGQVPVAYVALQPGFPQDGEDLSLELINALHGRVPGYARPQTLTILAELPLTSTGKVARGRLRALGRESQ